MADKKWNPRYVLWAKSNGNTPEVQATKDGHWFEGEFTPNMMEFMFWIRQQWRDWAKELGFVAGFRGGVEAAQFAIAAQKMDPHKHFDEWLQKKVEGSC